MKVRDGYLDLVDRTWDDRFVDVFVERRCVGVLVGSFTGPALDGLGPLHRLPGLRGLSVIGDLRDGSAIASLPRLESLHLAGSCSGPLPLAGLRLVELTAPFPRDVDGLGGMTALRRLHIFGWPRTHPTLSELRDKPDLRYLRIEFVRTASFSVGGFRAPALEELRLYSGRLVDPRNLADLSRLRVLHLYGTKIDSLEFARHLPRLRTLIIDNGGDIATLEPLRGHPGLVEVAVAGRTTVVDGDLTPLLDLPGAEAVAVERGAPHYSHRPAQVRRSSI